MTTTELDAQYPWLRPLATAIRDHLTPERRAAHAATLAASQALDLQKLRERDYRKRLATVQTALLGRAAIPTPRDRVPRERSVRSRILGLVARDTLAGRPPAPPAEIARAVGCTPTYARRVLAGVYGAMRAGGKADFEARQKRKSVRP